MNFKLHTQESSPEESKAQLDSSLKSFGMIPNLHAVMAEAPNVLKAYKLLHDLFQKTSFDNEELTVIWQTINVENDCHYCVPAHTGIAKMMGIDDEITEALRNSTTLPTQKLQVLHETTLALVRDRGRPDPTIISSFYQVGYENRQLLEIVLGISQKIMSNYINHLSETPIDEAFKEFAWSK
ncbi:MULTISPECIES: carboxymuconolactone decarboxylase family protein [Colwellia]|jgi:alkylhydroperoxidase family enzyme|uniref:Putative alkylhydroperoxidase AhpD family core domain protein n=1 Tax=Colwellia psychrerythraea (strain 34H / ATCC BAA-681) TaxID=167879 RepID=Q484V3_COLP3|nr:MULTISPECIES: carboxymuconolactone decarboxylase family protein [Colwellia]AAZ28782.1 putative alkylhydroperoxidase AhpD family core domain protein [Colwellia psychrerythraea 34H]PKH89057.1 carboxymuconolactone decarboxylase family protein [Colwellia sp. Bg11-28]